MPLESGLHHAVLGGVDHERGLDRLCELLHHPRHLLGFIRALRERHAHVQHVRAAAGLLARHFDDRVVVVLQQQLLDLAAALAVDTLADHGRAGILDHPRGRHGAGSLRLVQWVALFGGGAFEIARFAILVGAT